MTTVARKGARTKARRLREEHGVPLDEPLSDILRFAEGDVGLVVFVFEHLRPDLSGVAMVRGEQRLVFLNGSHGVVRLRFSLAHEIGHHCFHDDQMADALAGKVRPGHWIEVRANTFASELLMPLPAVERWQEERGIGKVDDLYDLCEFASRFGVSAEAALRRLDDAGLVSRVKFLRDAIEDERHFAVNCHMPAFEDSMADVAERLPYIPDAHRSTPFVKAALGDWTLSQAAAKMRTTEAALRRAWGPLGLLPPA